ncbi:DUF262 domain-containing protein [Sulfurimonas sp. ST-25]|uniref:DUF262 domain-containing protein n=1 Tax=Sulfurimonas sp. ST-25 TaxID=3400151 RepID=UPI003A8AC6F3
MNITPNKLTIGQLFANQNEQFIIPAYQRRYAWKEAQTEALFDDIDLLQDNDSHLFGMLVFHTNFFQGGLNKPELVDGQQRITTLSILLMSIRKRFVELGKDDKAQEITKMLTSKGYDDVEQNKVILGDLDNPDYIHLVKDKNFEQMKNENLKYAYQNFNEWLSDYDSEKLNRFYYKLINVAVVIRLDIGMAKDAFKLFETINNRGLRLSATDLIKNFIFGHSAQLGDDVLDDIKEKWTEIITNLDGIDTDDFLRQYMCMQLTRKISFTYLVEEFKKYYFSHVKDSDKMVEFAYYGDHGAEPDETVEEDDETEKEKGTNKKVINKIPVGDFVDQIKASSRVYKKIVNRTFDDIRINRHLYNLERILSMPSYIFLMNLLGREYSDSQKVAVLKTIETFMLRRHICEARTGEHDDIFAKLNRIFDEDTEITVEEQVKNKLEPHLPADSLFKANFPTQKFKGKLRARAKYILEQLEYEMSGNTGEFTISSSSEVHLEHIIPETINTKKSKNEFGDWEVYLGQDANNLHQQYVHLIGNMTLLAGSLNIIASNNPYADKQESYRKSNIQLTQELANNYQNFKFDEVESRGKKLADRALHIWKFEK